MGKKEVLFMKKKVVILTLCAIFLLSSSIYAATTSKVGKKITAESPVYLDGQLLNDAVILEGTSFVPVRVLSEALGLDVKFESSKEGSLINLTSPETKEVTKEMVWKKAGIEADIIGANNAIDRLNQEIEHSTKQLEAATHEILVKTLERSIAEAKEQIITAQANIIKYTNELLELESAK